MITYDNQNRNVDLSRLPIHADECQESAASKECAAHPVRGCLPCVREWQPVAWDKKREIFCMAAGTGTSHNRPWIILGYELRTRKLKRIADYFGGGFDDIGTVSPSGKYLAYVRYQVCGACCGYSSLGVVDVETLKYGSSEVPIRTETNGLSLKTCAGLGQRQLSTKLI